MLTVVLWVGCVIVGLIVFMRVLAELVGVVYIANDKVGVVEKLWGRSIPQGRIIALDGEAGLQCEVKRGGIHFGLPRWKYKIHRCPLVTIPQGQLGYVFARDGRPLGPDQTLAHTVPCSDFQDARAFLASDLGGQRGRQRAVLREGVYAINLALFVVITETQLYALERNRDELEQVGSWQKALREVRGFSPVVIGSTRGDDDVGGFDNIGVVTVHDGTVLSSGEIIAPEVSDHNNFQNPDAFVAQGGCRGRQYAVLTDGTYFINRWFASVEQVGKTLVPIGYVGVVISYVGKKGADVSGTTFRHGEQVKQGERGVWAEPLGPGKYAFNPYAGEIVMVPTTNFVLHWITGRSEAHKFDENLRSIDLVTKDAYEPVLPLSLVVHIDYQKAPGVIQRFGNVEKLITQTIDPMLSAYFRDVSHQRTFLELLQNRDEIQSAARTAMKAKFAQFDIELIDVLIGKPDAGANDRGKIESLLEQLRMRQLSREQVDTFEQQRVAAEKRKTLEEATAIANKQADLTNSSVQIRIVENHANAELAKAEMRRRQTIVEAEASLEQAHRQASQRVVLAEAEAKQTLIAAEAASKSEVLRGKGEGSKALQIGLAEAEALRRKVAAYGDPRLYALVIAAGELADSAQPLVPERVFLNGGNGDKTSSVLETLLSMLLASNTSLGNLAPAGTAPINGDPATDTAHHPLLNDLLDATPDRPDGPGSVTSSTDDR